MTDAAPQNEEAVDPAQPQTPGAPETISIVDDLQKKLAEANDKVLRTLAELENYRKRASRDVEEQRRYAAQPVLQELLPILDNLHRAIEAGKKARVYAEGEVARLLVEASGKQLPVGPDGGLDFKTVAEALSAKPDVSIVTGVEMLQGQLYQALDRLGCKRIETVGQTFDPHLHEVLSQFPSPQPAMAILQEVRPGFRLHERVIRAAQVLVSSGPPAA